MHEVIDTTNSDSVLYYQMLNAGMSRWIPVVAALMYQYDGVQYLLGFEDEYPLNSIMQAIDKALKETAADRDSAMLVALTQLPFLFFRARRGMRQWDPLAVPLREFIDDTCDEDLVCWMCPDPNPTPAVLRNWLLVRLPAVCV